MAFRWNASFGNRPRDAFPAECDVGGHGVLLPRESFLRNVLRNLTIAALLIRSNRFTALPAFVRAEQILLFSRIQTNDGYALDERLCSLDPTFAGMTLCCDYSKNNHKICTPPFSVGGIANYCKTANHWYNRVVAGLVISPFLACLFK